MYRPENINSNLVHGSQREFLLIQTQTRHMENNPKYQVANKRNG